MKVEKRIRTNIVVLHMSRIAFAKSCILKVSQDFKTFLRSLARLSRLLKLEKYTMNIV